MLNIAVKVIHSRNPNQEFGNSGKEALLYALTKFFNSHGLMVLEQKVREVKTHVRGEKYPVGKEG